MTETRKSQPNDREAAQDREAADDPKRDRREGPEPTHDLLLANGQVVEHFGAIPTHVGVGDRVWPVLRATER